MEQKREAKKMWKAAAEMAAGATHSLAARTVVYLPPAVQCFLFLSFFLCLLCLRLSCELPLVILCSLLGDDCRRGGRSGGGTDGRTVREKIVQLRLGIVDQNLTQKRCREQKENVRRSSNAIARQRVSSVILPALQSAP